MKRTMMAILRYITYSAIPTIPLGLFRLMYLHMQAVLVGNIDVVNALLHHSTADTRVCFIQGFSRHWIIVQESFPTQMRNDEHLTALQLAGQRGNVEVVDLIVEKESGLVRAPDIPSYVVDTPKGSVLSKMYYYSTLLRNHVIHLQVMIPSPLWAQG